MYRDVKVWLQRATECRNPLILAQAFNYDLNRLAMIQDCVALPSRDSKKLLMEIEEDTDFIGDVQRKLTRYTQYSPRAVDFMLFGHSGSVFFNEVTLYVIVRAFKPNIMVETGGTPGKSTAFILRAMERNQCGHLYTIDLPPGKDNNKQLNIFESYHEFMPSGALSGWVVPEYLRERHTQLIGASREHLPSLLEQVSDIDVFLHDSDHSYENMTWEFETAYSALGREGLLLSDDVLANDAFSDFCISKGLAFRNVYNLGAARSNTC